MNARKIPTSIESRIMRERDEAKRVALLYREALEALAANINAAGTPPQPWRDMLDSWHFIARTALEAHP